MPFGFDCYLKEGIICHIVRIAADRFQKTKFATAEAKTRIPLHRPPLYMIIRMVSSSREIRRIRMHQRRTIPQ